MFNEIQIAQSEFQLHNARYNNMKEVEGMTVQAPNIIDRIVSAVRNALTSRTTQQPRTSLTRNSAIAK